MSTETVEEALRTLQGKIEESLDVLKKAYVIEEDEEEEPVNKGPEYPKVTIELPEGTERKILEYWDWIFTPSEGIWVHPEDVVRHKRYREAIAVLLEFFND